MGFIKNDESDIASIANRNLGKPLGSRSLVILGDSMAAMNTDGSSGTSSAYWGARGAVAWAQVLLGFPFYCPAGYKTTSDDPFWGNVGIGGDTTTNMLARFDTDVTPRNPNFVYLIGGTNDIKLSATYETVTSNLEAIIDKIISIGAIAIVETISPRDAAGTYWDNDAQKDVFLRTNEFLRRLCELKNGMYLVDTSAYITDRTNGDTVDEYTYDGVHSTPTGAYWRGKAIVEAIGDLLPNNNYRFFNAADVFDVTDNPTGNRVPNGTMQGATGTVTSPATGVASDDWRLERASGSTLGLAGAKSTRLIGGNTVDRQKISFTAGGAGASGEIGRFRTNASTITGDITVGEFYEAGCDIQVSNYSGDSGAIEGIYLEIRDISTGGTYHRCLDDVSSIAGAFPDENWSGSFVTTPMPITGTDGIRIALYVNVDCTKSATFDVEIDSIYLRKLTNEPIEY